MGDDGAVHRGEIQFAWNGDTALADEVVGAEGIPGEWHAHAVARDGA